MYQLLNKKLNSIIGIKDDFTGGLTYDYMTGDELDIFIQFCKENYKNEIFIKKLIDIKKNCPSQPFCSRPVKKILKELKRLERVEYRNAAPSMFT